MLRPKPLPPPVRRTFLTAAWRGLAILNFEIDPAILKPYVPRGVELDFFGGKTYVSIVGFQFLDVRLWGAAIPCHSRFEEVNLRFYVARTVGGEVRRGVVFLKELVKRRAVAAVARSAYNENYAVVPMRHRVSGLENSDGPPLAEYQWRTNTTWSGAYVRATGDLELPSQGSLSQFIVEHYWGYSKQRDGGTLEYRVDHPPWRVWSVSESRLECDVAALYGPQFVDALAGPPASALMADGSPVVVYCPERIA